MAFSLGFRGDFVGFSMGSHGIIKQRLYQPYLVGGLEHEFYSPYIGNKHGDSW